MIIEKLDGTRIDTADYNLTRLFHYIPSIEVDHNFLEVQGRAPVYTDSSLTARSITVEFLMQVYDIYDYYLVRDMINALFTRREEFYIIFKNEPYKRYKVVLASGFQVPPNQRMDSFEIEFICTELYGESIASTSSVKEWDVAMWAWNGAITWDEDLNYRFTTNRFTVNNLGTATIDPRESALRISINGSFPTGFTLRNTTTNETYQYTGALTSGDILVIDGINTFVNGVNRFAQTNKRLLTLREGLNAFEFTGGALSSVSFDFRFLYL